MSHESSRSHEPSPEPSLELQWRRDPGYFLVGTLLLFLVQAAAIAVSGPNIPETPHTLVLSVWAAWLALRISRKRRERRLLENASITIEPPRPNLGGTLAVTLALNPSKRLLLSAWSVSLACTQVRDEEEYAEDEPICELERVQYVGVELAPREAFRFSNTLTLPPDVPATGLTSGLKIAWYMAISVELAPSPVWGLKKPVALTILP